MYLAGMILFMKCRKMPSLAFVLRFYVLGGKLLRWSNFKRL